MAVEKTVTVLDLSPVPIQICTTRGNDVIWTFQMQEDGVDLPITGFAYVLTVDTREDPPLLDVSTRVFQLTGAVVSPNVSFQPSKAQMALDPDTDYFVDIRETNLAGDVRTIAKGTVPLDQDISK